MNGTFYLIIKISYETELEDKDEVIHEMQTQMAYSIGDTQNVRVTETEVILTTIKR
jgi:hypothetical protein